jgi:glycosyltransferase involved in cell wall biosynthesis
MKTLQIYNRPLGTGGEELIVNTIQRAFDSSGEFVTHYFESSDWIGPNAPPKWKQALWTINNPHAARKVHELQSQTKADAWLLHGVYPIGSTSIYRQAALDSVPIIQFIHNFRPFSVSSYVRADCETPFHARLRNMFWREIKAGTWQQSRLKTAVLATSLSQLRRRWLGAIKAWIATTNFMRDRFVDAGIAPESIFVLPFMWTPIAEPPQSAEGDYYLFLGRLMDDKGVRVLCRAWDIVRARLGNKAPSLVIGGDGPLASFVADQTKANPLIRSVGVTTGDAKRKLISECRAMIAPSLCYEALGLVTYEAYDFAKPMLAARSGGLGETVQHGVTGYLHQPGNAEELAEQIIATNGSADHRKSMGANGRKWLLSQPTPNQWLDHFRQVVQFAKRV